MKQYGPYNAFDIEFDKSGALVAPPQQAEALAYLGAGGAGSGVHEIFVMSHGWNNNIPEAQLLYNNFFASYGKMAAARGKNPAAAVVLGVLWPSQKFADPATIPGGAAGVASSADALLNAQLDSFAAMFADDPKTVANVAAARRLIPTLSVDVTAQDRYVQLLVELVPQSHDQVDEGIDGALQTVANLQGRTVLQRLAQPVAAPNTGGAAGFNLGDTIKTGAANLANLFTYYTMKDRAGIVGRTGAATLVRALRAARPDCKIHLIGHSFGGRLVTSLANALAPPVTVSSMTLLEAAYSHNGLATNWDGNGANGSFQNVATGKTIEGPILITHSVHDVPVGIMYPTASRLMNQVAASVYGGPDDKFGGMGRNGAQHTPQVTGNVTLLPTTGTYPAAPAQRPWILNINGDGPNPVITGHGDICKDEIAHAMLTYL